MNRPRLIAHRGASLLAPENTLPAFAHALRLGAAGIELDVHRTADDAIVVHHDPIPRVSICPPALAGRPFRDLTRQDLRSLRVDGDTPIPTLDEVLELVGDRLTVYCELKGEGVVELAAPALARHRGPSAIHAFDHRAVQRAAELAPTVPRGILVGSRLVDTAHALRAAGATTLWPQVDFVDPDLVDEVHELGGEVIPWTVRSSDRAVELIQFGVDALCVDDLALPMPTPIESTLSRIDA